MSQYLRPRSQAASIFFTVALAQRGDDLLLREIELLRQAVRITRAERPFRIEAWVVLPDHLHAIWTLPAGDGDYATRWRLIKARFSMAVPKGPARASHELRSERGVWQRRYWDRHLRNAEDFESHMRFCRADPALHGLVRVATDWPFSSFHQPAALQMVG